MDTRDSDDNTGPEKIPKLSFNVRKWVCYGISVLNYMLVHFHRYCPTALADPMSQALGVSKSQLGIFSSMYYWSYAIMQPIVGCLSDVYDSSIILGVAGIVSALGSLVTGLSRDFYLSSVARFFVGIGCSCPYCAICKVMSNWFQPRQFYLMNSILFGLGGIGGILSQSPLIALANAIDWDNTLILIACLGFFFSLLAFLFLKSYPTDLGYPQVPGTARPGPKQSVISNLKTMWRNLMSVVSIKSFWIHSISLFFATSAYQNVAGMWAVPYLTDVYGITPSSAGTVTLSLQFVMVIGSPLLGSISFCTGQRKWLEIICYSLGFLVCLVFTLLTDKLPLVIIAILFFLLGVTTNSTQSFTMPMYKDMVPPDLAGTVSGCGNCFCFLGAAVMQSITSSILGTYEVPYDVDAYRFSLWLLCAVCVFIAVVAELFLPTAVVNDSEPSEEESGVEEEIMEEVHEL